MVKKAFLFLQDHIMSIVRWEMALLILAAISKHFAMWLCSANVVLLLVLNCGKWKGWE